MDNLRVVPRAAGFLIGAQRRSRRINPSSKPQSVPPIEAQLRDSSGRVVYSWTIAPPARVLSPGESRSFNSAEMGVPPSGISSTVTLTLKS